MKERLALKIILAIAIFGVLFSGTLSYQELFLSTGGGLTCPAVGKPGTLFGYPACVYGFFMYLILAILAAIPLFKKKTN